MTRIKGVDISYCQEGINFSDMKKAGVKFVIIRAGFSTKKDITMDKFIADCKAYNIPYGFYWYSYAMSVSQAKAEAEKCVEVIKGLSPTYPVFFDMEEKKQINGLNNKIRTDMAVTFCETVKKAGYTAGVYANPSFMECYYNKSALVGKYDIWLAHWTYSPDKPSKYNYGQTIWQWGIDKIGDPSRAGSYDIDGDICFKDYSAKAPQAVKKAVDELAREVIDGKWGNEDDRKKRLTAAGYDYYAVQKRVNEILYATKKSVDELAREVIHGDWGNGEERKRKLTAAGYDYSAVQKRVNEILK